MSEKVTIARLKEANYHKPKKFFKLKGQDGEEALADKDAVVANLKQYLEETKSTHQNWINYRVTADIGVVVDGDSVTVTEPSDDAGPAKSADVVHDAFHAHLTKSSGYTLDDLEALDNWAKHRVLTSGTPELQAIRYRCLFNNAVMKGLKAGTPIPGDEPPLDDEVSDLPF